MMATLYDVEFPTINEHIKKFFATSELEETATIRNFRIVQTKGHRQVSHEVDLQDAGKITAERSNEVNPFC
jgi:hypothetical protein